MHALQNDGLSPISIAFIEGKFLGAINHHKKTATIIQFDGARRKKTAQFGRTRAAHERQVIEHELLEMFAEAYEQQIEDKKREKEDDERDLARFDSYLSGEGGYIEERCDECGRRESLCRCYSEREDSHYRFCRSDEDRGCSDCGCLSCVCDDGRDSHDPFDYDLDWFPMDYQPRSFDATNHQPESETMTEEEAMKLSDALWLDHEFTYGKNNMNNMTRSFGDEHYNGVIDFFDDFYAYPMGDFRVVNDELVFVLDEVDEFGGLPNHFDPSFNYRTFFWEGLGWNWDFSVDLSDLDLTFRISPLKARRASRFSETTGTVSSFDWDTGTLMFTPKVKNLSTFGRTSSYKSVYSRAEKEIQGMRDKSAAKREFKRLLDEHADDLFLNQKEANRARALEEQKLENQKPKDKKSRRGGKKSGATTDGSTSNSNVDYSLPSRRMCIRKVHVERWGEVNGVRTCISSGIEKMLVRR